MRNFFRLLRRADGVFVFTPDEYNAMIDLAVSPERVHTIGIGPRLSDTYDAAIFREKYGIRRNMVLFLGQKYPYKGFDVLIDAAPLVWRKYPDTSFVFMGPHYADSKKKILSLGDDRIVDIGQTNVFDPLKASALAATDIFALPSRQEGIGGVYIEAWAMKKPVIACRIPFLPIEDGADGFLVQQNSHELAERIIWLLDHPEESAVMGARGFDKVQQKYNWSHIVSYIEKIYFDEIDRERKIC